ncbi:MAG: PEP-CTERM sorting domain-containing protein [Tepidisphaeraceae bacterium]
MSDSSGYVFGAAMLGTAVSGLLGIAEPAEAASVTNATFTFESASTYSTSYGTSYGPLLAESGTGSAYGFHANAATFNFATGNGSANSLVSGAWSAGDYYQFSVPTTAIQNVIVSFDQWSSYSLLSDFSVYYSTDGTNFVSYTNYAAKSGSPVTITSTAPGGTSGVYANSWTTIRSYSEYRYSFDLSAVAALNDNPNAAFRLVLNTIGDTTSYTSLSTATSRVDNVVVSGTTIPEPTSVALMTVGAAGLLFRRRQS